MSELLVVLVRYDERILHALVARRTSLVDRVMRTVTHLGDAKVTIPLALVLFFGLVPGYEAAGQTIGFVLVTSHLGVQLVKRRINRPRPRLPVGCSSMIEAPDRFSFPSGHAAASLSIAVPMATQLPGVLGMAALGAAAMVGVSRCYLGVHYPGDVIVGWLLVAASLWMAGPILG